MSSAGNPMLRWYVDDDKYYQLQATQSSLSYSYYNGTSETQYWTK